MRGRTMTLPLGVLVLALFADVAFGDTWRTITAGWKPNRVAIAGGKIWACSEGGLYDVAADFSDIRLLNKDDGLYANDVNVVRAEADESRIWIGYDDAGVDRIDPATGDIVQRILDFVESNEVFSIYDIFLSETEAYVATDIGVSKLIPSDYDDLWVVSETYRNFGVGTDAWPQPVKVESVFSDGEWLFVGGINGIAVASLEDNLFDPGVWQTFDFESDLPHRSDVTNNVSWFRQMNGEIYAGLYLFTVVRWDGEEWDQATPNYRFYFGMTDSPDSTIYCGAGNGLYKWNRDDNTFDLLIPDSLTQKVFDLTWAFGNVVGVLDTDAKDKGGVFRFDPDTGEYIVIHPNTPGGNQATQLHIDESGTVWITARSSNQNGIYGLTAEGVWESITRLDLTQDAFNYTFLDIGTDDAGGVWIGSRGDGLVHIMPTDTGLVPTWFNADTSTGARLQPMSNDGFVLIGGVAREPGKGMWLVNTYAGDELSGVLRKPLIFVPLAWYTDPTTEWQTYSTVDGVPTIDIKSVIRDHYGRLWFGPLSDADQYSMVMMNPAGTPMNPDDDSYMTFGTGDVGFTMVNDMVLDDEGFLWVGAPDGLYYIDTNHDDSFIVGSVTGALGEEITAVALDPMGHIWCGTHNGVSVFNPARMSWVNHYTVASGRYPSRLVDDDITCMEFNGETGEAWIGTNIGVSVLTTPYRNFGDELGEIDVRPQPFLLGNDGVSLQFMGESLVNGATIKIFTPSGRLVRELSFSEASSEGWDGRNKEGELVSSGVYLLLVTDPEGHSKVGKAAVVRK